MERKGEGVPHVLVVDDEPYIREILYDLLGSEGYAVNTVENGLQALEELRRQQYNLVITDLKMPVMGGVELLNKIKENNLKIMTIIMTAHATIETAIDTMKKGAYDYILKPFKIDEIIMVVQRALEKERLERENVQLKEALGHYRISEAMSSTLSLERVLEMIVEFAKKEVEANGVSLMLRGREDGGLCTEVVALDVGEMPAKDLDAMLDYAGILKELEQGNEVLFSKNDLANFVNREVPVAQRLQSLVSVPLAMRGKIDGMLNVYSFTEGVEFHEGQRKALYILASRAANAIENARLHEELKEIFRQTIEGFAFAIEAMDPYTLGHSRRVTQYSERIARQMGLSEKEVEKISHAATLHDIGKIGMRIESLNKKGNLTEEEKKMFRSHPKKGCTILEPISFLQTLIPIIYHHHERYDGLGYPDGKAGEEIPLEARILAVADSYDAMTSTRAYRGAMSREEAIQELKKNAGTQFDPGVVEAFMKVLEPS
jgi:putative nucleotidyltransferase with HDIG domain